MGIPVRPIVDDCRIPANTIVVEMNMRTDLSYLERQHLAGGGRMLIVEANDDFGWHIKILNSSRELVCVHSIPSCERANEIAQEHSLLSDGQVIVRIVDISALH